MYSALLHPASGIWVLGKIERNQAIPMTREEIDALAEKLNGTPPKVETVVDLNRLATELRECGDGGYTGTLDGRLVLDGAWEVGDLVRIMSGFTKTVEITPKIDRCDQEVFDKGVGVLISTIPKQDADEWCAALARATGWRIDWHYFAGRVRVLCLPPLPKTDKVGPVGKPATQLLMDEAPPTV